MEALNQNDSLMNTNSGSPGGSRERYRGVIRSIMAVALLFSSIWLSQLSGGIGYAAFLSTIGVASNQLSASDQAVKLSPNSPETHYDRAQVLMNLDQPVEAVAEFENAIRLRKHDYYLWLEYGLALDQTGQEKEALSAFQTSVRLAPYFAEPHWQLGNLLFRLGQMEEAFTELRKAVNSDHTHFSGQVDLAFAAANGDAKEIQRLVKPQTSVDHLKLANFFAQHGKAEYALEEFESAGLIDNESKRYHFKQLVTNLIKSKNFEQAHLIWAKGYGIKPSDKSGAGTVEMNGDFEEPITRDVIGFGWQTASEIPTLKISLDTSSVRQGVRSLLIEFRGESDPFLPALFQTVLVQPKQRYTLSFSVKTRDLVTGGPPVVSVYDLNTNDGKLLAGSDPIQVVNSDWTSHSVKFTTGEGTKAVQINVSRRPCTSPPCPIFGKLWLDGFSLDREL